MGLGDRLRRTPKGGAGPGPAPAPAPMMQQYYPPQQPQQQYQQPQPPPQYQQQPPTPMPTPPAPQPQYYPPPQPQPWEHPPSLPTPVAEKTRTRSGPARIILPMTIALFMLAGVMACAYFTFLIDPIPNSTVVIRWMPAVLGLLFLMNGIGFLGLWGRK